MKKNFVQYVTQYITASKFKLFLAIGLLCCFYFSILYIIAPPILVPMMILVSCVYTQAFKPVPQAI